MKSQDAKTAAVLIHSLERLSKLRAHILKPDFEESVKFRICVGDILKQVPCGFLGFVGWMEFVDLDFEIGREIAAAADEIISKRIAALGVEIG